MCGRRTGPVFPPLPLLIMVLRLKMLCKHKQHVKDGICSYQFVILICTDFEEDCSFYSIYVYGLSFQIFVQRLHRRTDIFYITLFKEVCYTNKTTGCYTKRYSCGVNVQYIHHRHQNYFLTCSVCPLFTSTVPFIHTRKFSTVHLEMYCRYQYSQRQHISLSRYFTYVSVEQDGNYFNRFLRS